MNRNERCRERVGPAGADGQGVPEPGGAGMVKRAITPKVRTIVIVEHQPRGGVGPQGTPYFDVHDGERYVTELCWDELLGTIARLTHPDLRHRPNYHMGLPEEHQARAERRAARRRA